MVATADAILCTSNKGLPVWGGLCYFLRQCRPLVLCQRPEPVLAGCDATA